MRRTLGILLLLTLLSNFAPASSEKKITKLKLEQHAAMHMIVMVDRDSSGKIVGGGQCTAYAVGPHTLLTAAHCNDPYTDSVYIDPADKDSVESNVALSYTVVRSFDHQDHMLLDVFGVNVNFTHIIDLPANVKPPVQGEHTYQWGNPNGIKDQYREGYVMGRTTLAEIGGDTEIDAPADSTIYMVSGPIIPGDSGSAVFSAVDGRIIGIVTYGFDDGNIQGLFPIRFSQAAIDAAKATAVPSSKALPARPVGKEDAADVILFSQHSHGGGHSQPGGNHSSPRPSGPRPRGEYRGHSPHYHNGRFDRDYYEAHFGPRHGFYFSGVVWYGSPFYYGNLFMYGDCTFMLMNDIPAEFQSGPVYIVEIDGLYYIATPNAPGALFLVAVQ